MHETSARAEAVAHRIFTDLGCWPSLRQVRGYAKRYSVPGRALRRALSRVASEEYAQALTGALLRMTRTWTTN